MVAAVRELKTLAEKGSTEAKFYLGVVYEDRGGGFQQDYEQALKWYKLAAQQGSAARCHHRRLEAPLGVYARPRVCDHRSRTTPNAT